MQNIPLFIAKLFQAKFRALELDLPIAETTYGFIGNDFHIFNLHETFPLDKTNLWINRQVKCVQYYGGQRIILVIYMYKIIKHPRGANFFE